MVIQGFPLKPLGGMVSPMTTRNPYRLSVVLAPMEAFYPTLRKWRYGTEFSRGFRFLEADPTKPQDGLETQSDYSFNEFAKQLLGLVQPIRLMTAQELENEGLGLGWGIKESLQPNEVVDFVNRFGQIGLADYLRSAKLQRPHTIDRGELTPGQAFALLIEPGKGYEKYLPILAKSYEEEPKKWRLMINKIQRGDLIPFAWIQKDLFDLARCVHTFVSLDKNYIDGETYLSLPTMRSKELRRFLLASEAVILPKDEDENYLPLGGKKGDPWGVSDKTILSKWIEFQTNMNRFLTPITYNAVRREEGRLTFQKTLGVETWLTYEILTSRSNLFERRCARKECRIRFLGTNLKAIYCSPHCGSLDRQKRKRNRAKNSSGKSQKKSKAKGQSKNAKT